jgi:hypothetical protein
MRTIGRGTTMLCGFLLLASVPLAAQRTPRGLSEVPEGERGGFWAGLSLGSGGEAFDLRDGEGYSDRLYRPTVSFRLGGTVNPSLRLGGEALVWVNERRDVIETLGSLLFVGQLYPAENAGFYLKGGVGLASNSIEDDFSEFRDTGFAGLVGAGYEIRLGRRFALVPSVDLVQHWYSERDTDGYRERLLNFGLGVLFQSGR